MIERVFIKQGLRKIELENYLKKNLDKAGFTGLDIVKTPLVTRIVLNVVRPGLAIGKEGQNIKMLTEEIGKKFEIENPQLEIRETPNASLNATAIVNKMASLLERGYSWRSVAFRTVRDITTAGAQGVELVLSGKLAGKGGRKRKQRVAEGYMKKVGEQTRLVDYAKASAYPKAGAIGIKLRIIAPNVVFPDKINVREAVQKELDAASDSKEKETAEAVKEEQAEESTADEKAEEKGKGQKSEKAKEATVKESGKKEEKKRTEKKAEKKAEKEAVELKKDESKKVKKEGAKAKEEKEKAPAKKVEQEKVEKKK